MNGTSTVPVFANEFSYYIILFRKSWQKIWWPSHYMVAKLKIYLMCIVCRHNGSICHQNTSIDKSRKIKWITLPFFVGNIWVLVIFLTVGNSRKMSDKVSDIWLIWKILYPLELSKVHANKKIKFQIEFVLILIWANVV